MDKRTPQEVMDKNTGGSVVVLTTDEYSELSSHARDGARWNRSDISGLLGEIKERNPSISGQIDLTSANAMRERRKQKFETELLEIQIDELVEHSLTADSWFRENFKLAPETSSFWTALPRYVRDCVKIPSHVSATLVELFMRQAIQKYSRAYK